MGKDKVNKAHLMSIVINENPNGRRTIQAYSNYPRKRSRGSLRYDYDIGGGTKR